MQKIKQNEVKMIKIKLEILGPVKKKTKENPVDIELAQDSTILDMMKAINYTETEAKFLAYVRNGEKLRMYDRLMDGDEIKAVLQVGGG
jgi:hypothetical protein